MWVAGSGVGVGDWIDSGWEGVSEAGGGVEGIFGCGGGPAGLTDSEVIISNQGCER